MLETLKVDYNKIHKALFVNPRPLDMQQRPTEKNILQVQLCRSSVVNKYGKQIR